MTLTTLSARLRKRNLLSTSLVASSLMLSACGSKDHGAQKAPAGDGASAAAEPGQSAPSAPDAVVCAGPSPKVRFETSFGNIVVQLDGVHTPKTVANFTQYVNDKFYDQTLFHRIIDGFMIQGGGHDLTGALKPTRDPIELEINPGRKHVDGTISMARKQDPNSANSQFFICDGSSTCAQLDGSYAPFGETIEGLDVVHKISEVPTSGGQAGKPHENVMLNAAYCIK